MVARIHTPYTLTESLLERLIVAKKVCDNPEDCFCNLCQIRGLASDSDIYIKGVVSVGLEE